MFPQAFGFKSTESLPRHKILDIVAPIGDQVLKTTSIGLDQNLMYNIGETTTVRTLKGKKAQKFANKTAVFAHNDEMVGVESTEQYEKELKDLTDLREELSKLITEEKNEHVKLIGALIGGIKRIKQKFSCQFAMSTDVTFDYLIKLREILCEEILGQFKS